MHRTIYVLCFGLILLSLLWLSPVACSQKYSVSPIQAPTPTPTSTCYPYTCTQTITPTPTSTVMWTNSPTDSMTPTLSLTASPTSTNTPTITITATPTPTNGAMVTTVAGKLSGGSADGPATAASFRSPCGVAVDSAGNIYIADSGNNLIRVITTGGTVSTLAGQAGVTGAANGPGNVASFNFPSGIAVDLSGNVYVTDWGNNLIREITPGGVVSTLAGTVSVCGSVNGMGITSTLCHPTALAIDSGDNIYFADSNSLIREINSSAIVSTLAGSGSQGFVNGPTTFASFNMPSGVALDSFGNIYVGDSYNDVIRVINTSLIVSTFAGSGLNGMANGPGSIATFNAPEGVATDSAGNVYVADNGNQMIRKITPGGMVSTLAGEGGYGHDDGAAVTATFYDPSGVAVDSSGNVYVADTGNNLIRKIQQ